MLSTKDPVSALVPATRAEQSLALLETLVPGSGMNNLSVVFEVDGRLGEWELGETLAALLTRHEVLRTVFHAADFGLIKHVVPADSFTMPLLERDLEEGAVEAFVAEPFALDGAPLVRAALFRGPFGDVCCLVVHHLVFDAVSCGILLAEFAEIYESVAAGLGVPEPAGPTSAVVRPPAGEESLAYWRARLNGFDPSESALSCGGQDVAEPTLRGGCVTRTLSAPALAAVRRLGRRLRAPEAVVLLAAYYVLLARHGAGPDLVVGSPADTRGLDARRAVGFHVNVLPLRAVVDLSAGFGELVPQVREAFLGALQHADVPVDVLVAESGRWQGSWRNTLFRHGFNYVPDAGGDTFEIDGMPARRLITENGFSKLDLEFFFLAAEDEIRIRAVHYAEVLGTADVESLVDRYDELLVSLDEQPLLPLGELPISCAHDRAVIAAANDTDTPVADPTLPEAVARTVAATPSAVAIRDGARQVTYAELWHTALEVRRSLVEAGCAGKGAIVALAGPRSPELAAAALGVWLAGAAYLPLDPEHPDRRTRYLLDDSGAIAVLAAPGVEPPVPPGVTVLPMPAVTVPSGTGAAPVAAEHAADPDDLALLIYTSGSTGAPKGALITHGGQANVVHHHVRALGAAPGEAGLWLIPFTFDPSGVDLFLPLVSGGTVVVAPDAARTDGRLLLRTIQREQITVVQASPTTWRLTVDEADGELAGVRVVTGGEALPPQTARRLLDAGCELFNAYGPSETTICSTMARIEPGAAAVDVGGPIANTRLFVVDEHGRELPLGVRGELCIAGAGVSAGYRNRPDLTAERFGVHPVHGRFYRTGDRASWLPSGSIALHGRFDRQVKLRGNRIELGEVEAVLRAYVDDATVIVADDVLTAFVRVGEPDDGLAERLWQCAAAELPRTAVPQEFVLVDELPITSRGKVDHRALERLARERRAGQRTAGAPVREDDALVADLIDLWGDLLGHRDVDRDANFFARGGNSLQAVRLLQRVQERHGREVELAALFSCPTPAGLARLVRAETTR
ncbi:amino acid adenylation domain-containing protein [Nonomuraea sp. NN258]|uniref:non-ribosomal peptide synthetase n=1 Tax=Nonomuraea antri TaxID=2730852 RepID=UPI001569963F|nr:non-ribosomal peptide synthetase [Nonomuraea antri]NRQ39370.1 amino acid adenylation domain-containing protein [Nonomuraea antri]